VALWFGAVAVAVVAILFALGSARMIDLHHRLIAAHPWLTFAIAPLGLGAVAWTTRRFFPGSQGSGIPQTSAALQITAGCSRIVCKQPIYKALAEQFLARSRARPTPRE